MTSSIANDSHYSWMFIARFACLQQFVDDKSSLPRCQVIVVHAVCCWQMLPYLTRARTIVQHVDQEAGPAYDDSSVDPSPVVHLEEPAQKQQLL